ncbi:MAG: 16S rRNA (guanine(527)-N(7))-methyltransferase RsmG [Flavobacteriaceae bacterium]|nr:16S rRNA (guanine(527)-N(7))-methyltransferase RsmG [Flavobacteriaceae bacterium]
MNELLTYFPKLSARQQEQFVELQQLYRFWNERINVISRKDIDFLYERHVLHSLAITKVQVFLPGSRVLDVGTGGGFPGIPLAIFYPEVEFHLVDSIQKKIKVVQEVAQSIELNNLTVEANRAEKIKQSYDFVVSRAVTTMPKFTQWVKGKFHAVSKHERKNGILYLKGGDLSEELKSFPKAEIYPIKNYFDSDFFDTKVVVYLPMR